MAPGAHGGSAAEPLLGARRRRPLLAPLYTVTFCKTVAFCIAKVPALSVRFQAFAAESGMDAAATASAYGRVAALRNLVEFIATPTISAWSDRVGRWRILFLSCLALGLECALLSVSGSLGTFSAVHIALGIISDSTGAVESSCIADATPEVGDRVVGFGRLFTIVGAAMVLGPALGGELTALSGVAPFVAGCVLCCGGLAYLVARVPEYLPESQRKRRPAQGARGSLHGGFLRLLLRAPGLRWYMGATALMNVGMGAYGSIQALWAREALGWSGRDLSRYMSLSGVTMMTAQGLVLPSLLGAFKGREAGLAQRCLLAYALQMAAQGAAPDGRWVHATLLMGTVGFCSMSVLRSLYSRCACQAETGLLSGGASAVGTASQVLGSIAGSRVFAAALRNGLHLGATHFVTASCFALAVVCISQAKQATDTERKDRDGEALPDVVVGA